MKRTCKFTLLHIFIVKNRVDDLNNFKNFNEFCSYLNNKEIFENYFLKGFNTTFIYLNSTCQNFLNQHLLLYSNWIELFLLKKSDAILTISFVSFLFNDNFFGKKNNSIKIEIKFDKKRIFIIFFL